MSNVKSSNFNILSRNERSKQLLLTVVSAVFALGVLIYILNASVDVVFSDYIRLTNSYLPDVFDIQKMLTPDILTREPITFLFRAINVKLFGFSVHFDRIVGLLAVIASSLVVIKYCVKYKISDVISILILFILYSLNKAEMYLNGSGYVHFIVYILFFIHFYMLDKLYNGESIPRTLTVLKIIPWITTVLIAGPYCAAYTVTILLAYLFMYLMKLTWIKKKDLLWLSINTVLPLVIYLISNDFAVEELPGAVNISLLEAFIKDFGYPFRFILNGLASVVLSGNVLQALSLYEYIGSATIYVLGVITLFGYITSVFLYFREEMYKETMVPILFLLLGFGNHLVVFLGRYIFMRDWYAWSSRYFLQYQTGVIGMLMVIGILIRNKHSATYRAKKKTMLSKWAKRFLYVSAAVILAGNIYSAVFEIGNAPKCKASYQIMYDVEVDYKNQEDDVLNAMYEYAHGADKIRSAFKILEDNKLNVFRDR